MSLATLKKAAKKPSSLIRLALADLKACEADPDYKIDMRTWHEPFWKTVDKKVCHVCLAGTVLAKSLDAPKTANTSPSLYIDLDLGQGGLGEGSTLADRVVALDHIRRGMIATAIYHGWHFTSSDRVQATVLNKLRKAFPKTKFKGNYINEARVHKPVVVGGSYSTKAQRAKFRRSMADVARRLEKVGL